MNKQSRVVIVGAGQTGRGFIGYLLMHAGVQVHFIDNDPQLVRKLMEQHAYQVTTSGDHSVLLDGYTVSSTADPSSVEAVNEAPIIFVSVGVDHLSEVDEWLHASIKDKSKNEDGSVPIILAENGINCARRMTKLSSRTDVVLSEAIVFCTTLAEKGLSLFREQLDWFPYQQINQPTILDEIQAFDARTDIQALMERKIYTYNCISAVIGYMGLMKGYEDYATAANDPEIHTSVMKVRQVIDQAVASEYHVQMDEQQAFSMKAVEKFGNTRIRDSIARNTRNPEAKLSENERIVGPLRLLLAHHLSSDELLTTAAYAIIALGAQVPEKKGSLPPSLSTLPDAWQRKILTVIKTQDPNGYIRKEA